MTVETLLGFWDGMYGDITLCVLNKSNYGGDFLYRAAVNLYGNFPISYYAGCTNSQEKLAIKIQKKLQKLNDLFSSYKREH